jgi:hypothetical protein
MPTTRVLSLAAFVTAANSLCACATRAPAAPARRADPPPPPPCSYTLYKFDADNSFKALSLDGTPGAFYFSPGSGENINDWVIYFQGGGW